MQKPSGSGPSSDLDDLWHKRGRFRVKCYIPGGWCLELRPVFRPRRRKACAQNATYPSGKSSSLDPKQPISPEGDKFVSLWLSLRGSVITFHWTNLKWVSYVKDKKDLRSSRMTTFQLLHHDNRLVKVSPECLVFWFVVNLQWLHFIDLTVTWPYQFICIYWTFHCNGNNSGNYFIYTYCKYSIPSPQTTLILLPLIIHLNEWCSIKYACPAPPPPPPTLLINSYRPILK